MGKQIVDVMMKPVRLSIPASGAPLDTPPDGSSIAVGVLRSPSGPLVALALHDSAGNMVTAMLNETEFHALAFLMAEAGDQCAAGAKDAPEGKTVREH